MGHLYNPRRLRGETSDLKKPFTFRNRNPSSLRPRFNTPIVKPIEPYRSALKTPVLINTRLSNDHGQYERACFPHEESYSEINTVDPENWGTEDMFEIENDYDEDALLVQDNHMVQDTRMKRKNSFMYSEREYAPQKRTMTPCMLPNKENRIAGSFMNDSTQYTPKRQAVLCTDTPKGFGFKLEKKEKSLAETLKESCPKICPKWNTSDSQAKLNLKMSMNSSFPRMFTVTVDKLKACRKVLSCGQVIYELYGILDKVLEVKSPKAKKLQLKSQNMKSTLMCTFYEIDRSLPKILPGQWQRCIVLWRSNNEFQCVTIRSATANELKLMDKWVVASSKSMAILLQTTN